MCAICGGTAMPYRPYCDRCRAVIGACRTALRALVKAELIESIDSGRGGYLIHPHAAEIARLIHATDPDRFGRV